MIQVGRKFFEHLLSCMCEQKYLHEYDENMKNTRQKIIDTAYHKAKKVLLEHRRIKINKIFK